MDKIFDTYNTEDILSSLIEMQLNPFIMPKEYTELSTPIAELLISNLNLHKKVFYLYLKLERELLILR